MSRTVVALPRWNSDELMFDDGVIDYLWESSYLDREGNRREQAIFPIEDGST